jgi:hypothetical protein
VEIDIVEVMDHLAVLEGCFVIIILLAKANQGQFMETSSYYPCWEVRVGVEVRVAALAAGGRF